MKRLYLFLDELKDNLSDFAVNTLIITFAAIFISLAVYSLSDYLSSMLYYFNPNTANVVKLISVSSDSVYEEDFFDFDEFEYGFTSDLYNDVFMYDPSMALLVVSEEFFDESLGLSGGVSRDTLADNSEKIKVIAVSGENRSEGGGGSMKNGAGYTVAKKWENNAPYYLITGVVYSDRAVIALDGTVNTEGFQLLSRTVVGKINIPYNEFEEKYQDTLAEKGWAVTGFNGFEAVAAEFDRSVTLTVLGVVIFAAACAAMIINNYLSFEKRKRAYEILITLGARKKQFILNSSLTRGVQLVLSMTLSPALLAAAERFFGMKLFSASSMMLSVGIIALILGVGLVRYAFFLKRTQAAR